MIHRAWLLLAALLVVAPLAFSQTITNIMPSSAPVGSSDLNITINGSFPTANGTPVPSWFDPDTESFTNLNIVGTPTTTQIVATIPASLMTSIIEAQIYVSQGESLSNGVEFDVTATLTSLSPNYAVEGSPGLTLTVNGANIPMFTGILWNGSDLETTYVSSMQLTAFVPSSLLTTPGTANVTLTVPTSPTSLPFNIVGTALTLTSLSPNTTAAGGSAFTLLVNGSQYSTGTVVTWNGSPLTTTYVSTTQVSAAVPASLITLATTASVNVTAPGQTSPTALPFTVTPTITSILPTSATQGGPQFTLMVFGAGYPAGTVVYWDSSPLTTTVVNSGQLNATVPASFLANQGGVFITAQVGGLTSNSAFFSVNEPPLSLTSLSPATAVAGGPQFTLYVNGGGFNGGTEITWNNLVLNTTFISAGQISATIPASYIATEGMASVGVQESGENTPTPINFPITPPITSIQPPSAIAGGPQFTLTVNGAGYVSGTTVYWNSTALTTTFVNSGQVTAVVPASLIAQTGTPSITVQYSGLTSNAVTFTINPALSLTSLSPNTTAAGGAQFTLLVNGGGFTNATTVTWNGTSLATTYMSAAQLGATVPASLIALAGTASVTVVQSGQNSPTALPFTITPTITTIQPNSATAGGAQFTLTVNGAGYPAGTVAYWNSTALVTSVVNSGQLSATVPASLIASPGMASITAQTGGLTSNSATFTIGSPPLTLTSLSPNTTAAGGAQFTLLVNGGGFTNATTVTWNGSSLATTFVSAVQLSATVPASLIALAGTASVDVLQSGQNTPTALPFTITPTITTIQPNSATAGGAQFTLIVNGAGYPAGTVAFWNSTALVTSVVNSGQLTASVPASLIAQSGLAQITAQTGGLTSNSVTFTIGSPPLTLTSLSPNTTAAGGAQFTLLVNGGGFTNATTVTWNGSSLATTYVSAVQLSATVPASLIALAGTASVDVQQSGQNTPTALPFTITPTITTIQPNSATAGGAQFTLIVNGAGYPAGTVAYWNSTALVTSVVNSGQLTASVPSSLIAQSGLAQITAQTGGLTSNAVTFTIGSPPLTLTSLSPNTTAAGGAQFTLLVNGGGFTNATTVTWNGSSLATTFVSAVQLSATVPASLIALAATASVDVVQSGQNTPTALPFTITPTITTLQPNTTAAGGPQFTLTINGAGYPAGTVAFWNSTALVTSVVNSGQLTATVPASLIVQSGPASITAQTGGLTSNAVTFTVGSPSLTLTSLSPNTTAAGGAQFTLLVNGGGFTNATTVTWNGSSLATTFVSAVQLSATVPASLIALAATASVDVQQSGQNTPTALPFTITPTITTLQPTSTAAGGAQFTLIVNGAGYAAGTVAYWNSTALVTSVVNSGQLTAAVPASLIAQQGTASITAHVGALISNAVNFTIGAAPPTLTSLSPNTATAGSAAFTLIANGSGFVSGTVVTWNGSSLSTTFISAAQVSAIVPASLIATVGTPSVDVTVPGQTSPAALPFTITQAPLILTSLSPATIVSGSPAFTLTVNGSGFTANTAVTWNGSALSTTYGSATQLTAAIPASLITLAGTASVNVSALGQTSPAPLSFVITQAPLVLTGLSPSSTTAGGPAFNLTVSGGGFTAGTTVLWNGAALSTTFVSVTQLTASVAANLIAARGSATITAQNGNVTSNGLDFSIASPVPPITLISLSPNSAPVGSPAVALTVSGSGFQSGTTVLWNGSPLATTFVSSSQLTTSVPASLLTAAENAAVSVTGSPQPASLPFTISNSLMLTSISPSKTAAGGPAFTLTASGTGFQASTAVTWNGAPLATTFVSSTQLTAAIPATLILNPGTASIDVTASASQTQPPALTFTIAPSLILTSLAPSSTTSGGPSFTLAVTGAGFASGVTLFWNNAQLPTTYISATQLTAAVSANLIAQTGSVSITAGLGSLLSNALTFTIAPPAPVITSLSPSPVSAGGPAFTLTVNGSGFISGAVVSWNGTPLTTTFVSGSQVTVAVPAADIAQPGSAQIALTNPSGPTSNIVSLPIGLPAPTITSISPASVAVGGPAFTLTVIGTGFAAGATVSLNGTALSTTYLSATQLTAAVPASLIAKSGVVPVTETNPGTPSSNAVNLTIGVPLAITSISPTTTPAGGAAFTLNVVGTGFLSGVTVSFNSTPLATTFVSATQLTAAVPANLIAQPGMAQITASNPGGAVSNAVSLAITPPTPTITSVTPSVVVLGGGPVTLTVTGTNFLPGTTVNFNGAPLVTTYVSPTQVTAVLVLSVLTSVGTAPITATNVNGTASLAFSMNVTAPVPAITSISPSTVSQGAPAFTLTVTGTNFVTGATVSAGTTPLTTTLISGTQLTAAVPANQLLQSGSLLATVTNPGSAPSNPAYLKVTPVTITSILPATVPSGGPGFTLTVNANGPVSGWTVMLNSIQLVTTTVTANQLTALVPASLIAQPGNPNVVLVSPSGAQSNAATLTVTPPAPTLTSLSPVSANVGDPAFTLSITGAGFDSASVVQWNGAPLSTTFISTTRLTAAVGSGQLTAPGTVSVTVLSDLGEASNALPFTVNPVTPAITAISPNSATAGGPPFSLTVNGTGFLTLTTIQWNTTSLTTHFVSATQVTADVPATLLAQAGTVPVTAVNPGNVVSAALTFTINPAAPAITSLSQTSATAGDPAFTLTVTGTGFSAGAVVSLGSNSLATTFVSATQLTAAVSANLLLLPGTYQVEVQQGTNTSNAVNFAINLPPPPALRLNPPATSAPAQQPTIDFGLNSNYPLALSGTVTLTFVSNATVPSDDPSIQFATGGRSFNFTVPANTTALPALMIQTGTVAGVITLNVTLTAAGVNVTPATGSSATITIPPSPPVIQSVTLTRGTGSLEVDINGYSTTRDMTTAAFQLTVSPGSALSSSVITVPVSSSFTSWYQSAASTAFGSQFTYSQQFNVTGDSSQIVSVTVTLTNSSGTSAPITSH